MNIQTACEGEGIVQLRQKCVEWDTPEILRLREAFCKREHKILSMGLSPIELRCVIIPQKGSPKSVCPFILDITETKWKFAATAIGTAPYLVAWNSNIVSGVNKTATKLTGAELYGPIIFIMLDHEYCPTHMSVAIFKDFVITVL